MTKKAKFVVVEIASPRTPLLSFLVRSESKSAARKAVIEKYCTVRLADGDEIAAAYQSGAEVIDDFPPAGQGTLPLEGSAP